MVAAARHAAAEVRPLADALVERLRPHAERVEIGGSLRRGKVDVKDIEIVLLNVTPSFYDYTERLVDGGHAAKALYGAKQTPRWGLKYRGLLIHGVQVELFTADSNNFGYQFWLRTGPWDANQYVATARKQRCTAFRLDDGYLWRGEYKLHVPDETTLFRLFGIPYLEPAARTVSAYRAALNAPGHVWGDPTPYVILPESQSLEPDAPDSTVRFPATWTAESRTWATARGLTQSDVDSLESERATFRRIQAENRTREAAKATAFEAWWREHDDERTRMYLGLRGLEPGKKVEPERKVKR